MIRTLLALALALVLAACGNSSPGPLQGTWRSGGFMPMTTTFRSGETEAMGIIEKVDYQVDGQSVLVTYKDGLMKGTSVRFVVIDENTLRAMDLTYKKVAN